MCVALPGTVLKVHKSTAEVDFNGTKVNAEASLVNVAPGDRVLVHAGCIIQKLNEKDAADMDEFMRDILEMEIGGVT